MRHTCMTIADIVGGFYVKEKSANINFAYLPIYFSPDYWKSAAKQYTFLHIIATVGVLIALDVALSTLFIPVGDNLRIKFDFLTRAVIGMVGGTFLP